MSTSAFEFMLNRNTWGDGAESYERAIEEMDLSVIIHNRMIMRDHQERIRSEQQWIPRDILTLTPLPPTIPVQPCDTFAKTPPVVPVPPNTPMMQTSKTTGMNNNHVKTPTTCSGLSITSTAVALNTQSMVMDILRDYADQTNQPYIWKFVFEDSSMQEWIQHLCLRHRMAAHRSSKLPRLIYYILYVVYTLLGKPMDPLLLGMVDLQMDRKDLSRALSEYMPMLNTPIVIEQTFLYNVLQHQMQISDILTDHCRRIGLDYSTDEYSKCLQAVRQLESCIAQHDEIQLIPAQSWSIAIIMNVTGRKTKELELLRPHVTSIKRAKDLFAKYIPVLVPVVPSPKPAKVSSPAVQTPNKLKQKCTGTSTTERKKRAVKKIKPEAK